MTTARFPRTSRTALSAAALTIIAGLMGCGADRSTQQMTADLERDLQLAETAQRPRTQVVSVIEGGPIGAPSGTASGRRDAVPTPRRAPRAQPRAAVQEAPVTNNVQEAPAPAVLVAEAEPMPAPVPESVAEAPSPEPAIVVIPAGRGPSAGESEGRGDHGTVGTGRRGGGWGTVIGVIIRGGSAGIDNCEEHDRRAGRRGGAGGMGGGVRGGGTRGGMGGGGTVIITGRPGRGGIGDRMDGVIGTVAGTPRSPYPRH
jgi:hypothetical protein